MKIFVISDTHGKIDQVIEQYHMLNDVDLILHLGDLFSDAKKIASQLGVEVLSVKGNMDGSFDRDGYKILETEFGNIFVAHGHMENVKQSPQNIMYKAESLNCKAAFFGHTHIPFFEKIGGIYLLNPGSITQPLGGRKGSYAMVNAVKDKLEATIIYLSSKIDSALDQQHEQGYVSLKVSKEETRLLKDLLNNSDRF